MDGRVQPPVSEWMRQHFDVDYVDTITEAGVARMLIRGPLDGLEAITQIESLKRKATLSVEAHGSAAIAVVAHHDCAGNPVSKEEQLDHLRRAVEVVASWKLPVRIVGLWVNEQWRAEVVSEA
jgi:hypothetical protein